MTSIRRPLDDDALDVLLDAAAAEYLAHARAHTSPLDILFALRPEERRPFDEDPANRGPSRASADAFDRRGQALRLLGYPAKYARALDAIEDAWDRKIGRTARIVLDAGRCVRILRGSILEDDLRNEPAFAELGWAMELFAHAEDLRAATRDQPVGALRVLAPLHRHMARLRGSAQQAERLVTDHVRRVFDQAVDVSGEDLAAMEFSNLRVLENVVWTDDTRWSPVVARVVGRFSRPIAEGVYCVHFDGLRDHEPARA